MAIWPLLAHGGKKGKGLRFHRQQRQSCKEKEIVINLKDRKKRTAVKEQKKFAF